MRAACGHCWSAAHLQGGRPRRQARMGSDVILPVRELSSLGTFSMVMITRVRRLARHSSAEF